MRLMGVGVSAVVIGAFLSRPVLVASPSCESLASLALPHTQITRAQLVPAGRFAGNATGILEPGAPAFRPYNTLPEFCRIAATMTPSPDSRIAVEVWMPVSGWNGKFVGVGNGGWAGSISVQALAGNLARGYAVASTDTGHAGNAGDGSFAFNHPEKLIDYSYRAVHEMTLQSKALIMAFLGATPSRSYWDGCSTGGRQGLKEAQAYPQDYDGILAGAPANYMTHMLAQQLLVAKANLTDPASYLPSEKFPAIHRAVLDACDTADGVKDDAIEDPTRCHFDPKVLLCASSDTSTCLTAAQVETVRRIYAPARDPKSGAEIFPGFEPGSELGWTGLAGPSPLTIPNDYYKYVVFKNPAWDFKTLDAGKDVALADALDNGADNAIDPNLAPFFARGGKLLMYHGWSDQLIAPRNSINYYTSVMRTSAGAAEGIRLFMMPDLPHCAANFDRLAALEQWVEQKRAPDRIIAAHITAGKVDRTRPLCAYPQVATYLGTGSTTEASSFVCKLP